MPDTKITALTAIGANPIIPATFPIPMVDLTDTSMAASGTTKKVTVNQILGAGGTATLASATITGAATVGTTLGVTGASTLTGNVAVGTTSSPWLAAVSALDIGSSGIAAYSGGITHTAYFDNTDSRWEYKNASSTAAVFLNVQGGEFSFNTAVAGTAGNLITFTQALGINTTGNLVLKGGTAAANGVGVTFPATQVASSDANCLDDYEEGTFTPTVTSVGGTGIVYVADASDSGRYTKIGRVVTFQVRLAGTYTGTFSYIRVALPFSSTASNPDGAVAGYNNSTGLGLSGRSDAGAAWFIVSNPQSSGNTAMYSGFITS